MKRSARLEKIANINLGFENIAGASLASSKTEFKKQENQLEQLKIYKQEYQKQLRERLQNSISANEILDYQYFFSSLDNAIEQQTEIVKQSASQVDISKTNWLNKKREVAKISRIAEKAKAIETDAQQKIEQKISDELNLSRFALKNGLLNSL